MFTLFKPTHTIERVDKDSVRITVKDPVCPKGTSNSIILTNDQFARYENWIAHGTMIQHTLYDLNEDQRELLISGMSPENFNRLKSGD